MRLQRCHGCITDGRVLVPHCQLVSLQWLRASVKEQYAGTDGTGHSHQRTRHAIDEDRDLECLLSVVKQHLDSHAEVDADNVAGRPSSAHPAELQYSTQRQSLRADEAQVVIAVQVRAAPSAPRIGNRSKRVSREEKK